MDSEQQITKALKIERVKETVEVWNICTCGRILHSLNEAQRGTCASCWFRAVKPETHKAINKLIASAFNGATEKQKDEAVENAFAALHEDEAARKESE
jgi:hypothetical protein